MTSFSTTTINGKLDPREIPPALWAQAWTDPASIVRIEIGETTLWLKKAQEPRGYWRYRFLAFAARAFRLPVLATQPPDGGNAAIELEARRIRALAKAGVRVPDIVAVGPGWLLLTDLGTTLDFLLEENGDDHTLKSRLMDRTLSTLLQVHRNGQYLSQCFARNIVVDRDDHDLVGFIDLEEDPIEVMDLGTAQARDILLLMKSVVRYFENDLSTFRHHFIRSISSHGPEIGNTILETLDRLQWARRLPAKRHLGRDYQRLEATLRAFGDVATTQDSELRSLILRSDQ